MKLLFVVATFMFCIPLQAGERDPNISFYFGYYNPYDYAYKILLDEGGKRLVDRSTLYGGPNNSHVFISRSRKRAQEMYGDPARLFFDPSIAACYWGSVNRAAQIAYTHLGGRGGFEVVVARRCRRGTLEVWDRNGNFLRMISSCKEHCPRYNPYY